MGKFGVILIAIILFLVMNILFYKVLAGYYKNEFGKRRWSLGGSKTFFWNGSIFFSAGVTCLIMYILKWINILTF
ncbi:hypothetical protein GCM10023163_28150 [Aestuariibaculum suncheonense]